MPQIDYHNTVKQAVNTADPMGLLAMNAPKDEYHAEITDLAEILSASGKLTPTDVIAVFNVWFDCRISDEKAQRIVDEVCTQIPALPDTRPIVHTSRSMPN